MNSHTKWETNTNNGIIESKYFEKKNARFLISTIEQSQNEWENREKEKKTNMYETKEINKITTLNQTEIDIDRIMLMKVWVLKQLQQQQKK